MNENNSYTNQAEEMQWYYVSNGQQVGPIPESELLRLYYCGGISVHTKVWKSGMGDWVEFKDVNFLSMNSPPPLVGDDINNTLVWILAFMPILGTVLEYIIVGALGIYTTSIWVITVAFNIMLCMSDEMMLRKAGYSNVNRIVWTVFIIPIYLFSRAKLLKQHNTYAIVWCITFLVLIFSPQVISQITGVGNPAAISVVQDGTLYAYPDETIEEMVSGFVDNPEWSVIVADDGNTYVNVEGVILYDNAPVDMFLQYRIYDDNTFEFYALEFDGIPQNTLMYTTLIEAMYYE